MSKFAIQAAVAAAILLVGLVLGFAMAPDTDELETRVAALQAGIEGQASASELAALKGQVAALGERLEALGAKLDSQAAAPAPGVDRLEGLEGSVEDLTAMVDRRLSALEARPAGGAQPVAEVGALKRELADLASRFAALEGEHAARHQQMTEAKESKMAAAARPAGLDAPGVHALGVGNSVWLVEKEVFLALSRVEAGEAARVYVNATPITLPLGQEVQLRGFGSAQGPCRATLMHTEGETAYIRALCR